MNDDLISRSKLLRLFDSDIEITQRFIDKNLHKVNTCLELVGQLKTLQCYRAIVEDMKTAYDMDKVLKKLDKEAYYTDIETDRQVVNLNEALDIVKEGGIDENKEDN